MELVLHEVEVVGLLAHIVAHIDWVSHLQDTRWRREHVHLLVQMLVLDKLALFTYLEMLR